MNSNPFQRLLVPTDLSEFSDLALKYALLFHDKLGSQITLMHAEEFTLFVSGEYPLGSYFEDIDQTKKDTGRRLHDYVTQHVPSTTPIATMLVDETPSRAIVRTAHDMHADLIVMGTHGRHGIRRALLGSVTERVLRETHRPVLTVTPKLSEARAQAEIRTILCPVNFTDVARAALESACGLAEAFGAQLIVMNVVERDDEPADVEEKFGGWVDPLVRKCTRYEQIVYAGDPASKVLEAADQIDADLIVVGAQHTLFSDATVIGATTERITRFARQPVLTITRRPAAKAREEAA